MHAPQTQSHRRTIRFWLNCLVLACILPAAIVATFIIMRSYNQERASDERDTIGTARALMQAVDAELTGVSTTLRVLALSPHLASGDLAKFYVEAQDVVGLTNGNSIALVDAGGQQLLNTLMPFGDPLPLSGNPDQFRRALETGEPAISGIYIGGVTRAPVISIVVPVFSHGGNRNPVYGLAMGILPERVNEILRRQKIPPDWVAGIVDSTGTIVARTLGGEQLVGKKASTAFMRALTEDPEGAFEGFTREGITVISSFSRSTISGWAVGIGIPKAGLIEFLKQALLVNIVGAVFLLLTGVALARVINLRISRSIRALIGPAVSLGSAGPIAIPPVEIQEVHELGQSLVAARRLIERQGAERDEAEARLAVATVERDELRRRIMRAQEQERLRLAHDLHDQTGQSLTAAILELSGIEHLVDGSDRDRVRRLRKQMEAMGQTLHRIAWELRPASIDELGLTNSLENYFLEWSAQHAIEVDYHCTDSALDERSDEIRTTIYRVVQEALTNVAKHATRATNVSIIIGDVDSTLRLAIEDNGCGFDPAVSYARLGLAGMRERLLLVGGELEIESSPGAGTTIFARIPLARERTAA